MHDRVACDQPGTVRGGDRIDRKARAHMRSDRVSDQLLAAQVKYGISYVESDLDIEFSLLTWEDSDVTWIMWTPTKEDST